MKAVCFRAGLGFALLVAVVGVSRSAPDPDAEFRRQQEREAQLRRQNTLQPEARIPTTVDAAANRRLPTSETPCFRIDKITWRVMAAADSSAPGNPFSWATAAVNYTGEGEPDTAIGRCLGANGINLIMKRVQNAIVSKGYVTTRVLAEPQDLHTGELILTVIPGRIRQVRFETPSPRASASNAIPGRINRLLNLRDIEQGLENFKRVPGVAADIRVYPSAALGANPGDSDLVIAWEQASPVRFSLSADNAGSEDTGNYQGGLTVSYDNPLGLNDLFYLSLNNDLGRGPSAPGGARGRTMHYSAPHGYWLLGLTVSQSQYHQTVVGALETYRYSGDSENAEIKLSHLLYRDAERKTQWHLAGWARASENHIDDTEVAVQRRRMGGWTFGVNHKEYAERTTLELGATYRRGTGAFGALPAPEESFGEGTARPRIMELETLLKTPFMLWGQQWDYQNALRAQWHRTPLTPQDRFAIGSRYTVRGFDGENTLAGDRGWFIRNDVSMRLGRSTHAVYLGADYGSVDGPSSAGLIGKHLGGAALGVRGRVRGLRYDVSLAASLKKPEGFLSDNQVVNFNLNWML